MKAQDVADFITKIGIPARDDAGMIDPCQAIERLGLLKEELIEYEEAMDGLLIEPTVADLEKLLDAMVDIIYVVTGTAIAHGFDIEEAWRRVHAANMKKVPSVNQDNRRRSKIDAVKPAGWKAPVLTDLVTPWVMTVGDFKCGTNGSSSAPASQCQANRTSTPDAGRSSEDTAGQSQDSPTISS